MEQLPCPFCGSPKATCLQDSFRGTPDYSVVCWECLATGSLAETAEEACIAWNAALRRERVKA